MARRFVKCGQICGRRFGSAHVKGGAPSQRPWEVAERPFQQRPDMALCRASITRVSGALFGVFFGQLGDLVWSRLDLIR